MERGFMTRTKQTIASTLAAAIFILLAGARPAAAQSLPNQVLALYPQRTGELVYVDATALRRSSHYPRIKAQVLPERFRNLEQWTTALGIDFESQVRQMSWAFIPAESGAAAAQNAGANDATGIGFVGVAEGQFSLADVEARARGLKLAVRKPGGVTIVSLGKSEQGGEFVFAFLDVATAAFGSRTAVEEIVARRAQGGSSVLDNPALRDAITQLNSSRSPVWFALDRRFSQLAMRQMLPEASQVQGFDAVAGRVLGSTLRLDLRNGLQSTSTVRCADSSDALLLSSAAQAAFAYQALRVRDSSPELAQAFSQVRVNRNDTRLDVEFALPESQFASLLAKNGLTIKF